MGRILAIALVLAAAAGAATIAAGGVKQKRSAPHATAHTAGGAGSRAAAAGSTTFPETPPPPRATIAGGPVVAMRRLAFTRARVTIRVGQAVRWKNEDNVEHTVTATDDRGGAASFDSGVLQPGHEFRFVGRRPGTFRYVCTIHPTVMHGIVVVVR